MDRKHAHPHPPLTHTCHVSCDITSCSRSLRQVPNFLLTQVRHMTQASNQRWDGLARTRKKLLQRRRNSNWTQVRHPLETTSRLT